MILKIVIRKGSDGYYTARCPSLKSCWSQGRTKEEAIENIREAIQLYLEPRSDEIRPDDAHEVIELAI